MHRMMASIVCRKAGVPVPEFALAMSVPHAIGKAIVKNVIDQHHLRFLGRLPIVAEPRSTLPAIETAEEAGVSQLAPRYHYCQRFVHSEYEYKVYGIGEKLLFYRQRPVLVNPDKMSTRVRIDEIPALASAARAALRATGLAVASLDFLEEDGTFYLTDVNCTPNFNHVEGGAQLVGDHLLACASRS
jgi:hypothetical protein